MHKKCLATGLTTGELTVLPGLTRAGRPIAVADRKGREGITRVLGGWSRNNEVRPLPLPPSLEIRHVSV